MSALAEPTELEAPAPGGAPTRLGAERGARRRSDRRALWLITCLTAAIACAVTFYATGGLNLQTMTFTEMALTLGASAAVVCAPDPRAPRGRRDGLWPLALLLAFTALTALSVAWSVQPDESLQDAGRMLAYSAVFAGAIALVRLVGPRWPAILGGPRARIRRRSAATRC